MVVSLRSSIWEIPGLQVLNQGVDVELLVAARSGRTRRTGSLGWVNF